MTPVPKETDFGLVSFLIVSLARLKTNLQVFQIAENMFLTPFLGDLGEHHSQNGEKGHVLVR
jgi:hypothetical protein